MNNIDFFLFLAAALCFVFESFNVSVGTFHPKWWALGIALLIVTQAF